MVLLTMTPAIVAGLESLEKLHEPAGDDTTGKQNTEKANEDAQNRPTGSSCDTNTSPSLDAPKLGNPISHGQIVELWQKLKTSAETSCSLERLLQGSHVYIPPPPPKREPTPEFKALMARLRREEEARAYERMVNPPPRVETFNERFPHASAAASFAAVNRPSHAADMGDDDVTYNDIQRQMLLLINFLVSIVGVAATLWVAARWWSLPARLFLAMGGAVVVGIAEVAVYSVYVWRMGEAKQRQEAAKEVKEVLQTWVVGQANEEEEVLLKEKDDLRGDESLRKRKPTSKTDG
jgi:uncharacterized membrane protein